MTNLSLDDVVALNALIVTAFGLLFALGRKGKRPVVLNFARPPRATALDHLNASTETPPPRTIRGNVSQINDHGGPNHPARHQPRRSYGAITLEKLEENPIDPRFPTPEIRQLNVFFNWNGHTWDAFEVLGVPAGSSRDSVVKAFHAGRAKSPDSIAFLQAATDAILKRSA